MKRIPTSTLVLAFAAFSAFALVPAARSSLGAQESGGSLLRNLETPGDFESRRASSADLNWRDGNGDCRPIEVGKTLTVAELEGPGRITHIWFTIAAQDRFYPRSMTLRIYWDGEEEPSVESPIGDFFAVGHGLDVPVNSLPVQVSADGKARNCYWSMPFRKSARITVSNDSDSKRVDCIFWYVDWEKHRSLPEDTMYFHAQYRQEHPCRMGEDYLLLDAVGSGVYVGTVLSVRTDEDSWFGEGDDRFYLDGAKEPTLRGTGTEDYFSDAWGFRQFTHPFYGVSVWEGFDADDRGTAYRWHIADPVRFHESLRVTIEHKGVIFWSDGSLKTGFEERADSLSSVAFWYQKGRAKRFASMPPAKERIVEGVSREAESVRFRSDPESFQVQDGPYSGGKQILFLATGPGSWIEVPFEVEEDGRYAIKADVTRSWDYGIYEVLLDGNRIGGPRNFHNGQAVVTKTEKLGTHALTKGVHVLRFSCVGRDPNSYMKDSAKPGHYLGIDRVYARKLFPRPVKK